MQPLLVLGSLDVWGRVTSGTSGKSPSTFAAAFCNKAHNNTNVCAIKVTSYKITPGSMHGMIIFRLILNLII
jgi:hypothetical protein